MPQAQVNGITLEYEIQGPPDGETLLLIMGLGCHLTRWTQAFLDKLIARGFRIVRYDNRDIGLSTHMTEAGMPDLAELFAAQAQGRRPAAPYDLTDMARDAIGLMGALGIARAHLVGVSMGGMIAQLVAAMAPEKVASLTSIMSTTGNPAVPPPAPEAVAMLIGPSPSPRDREAYAEHGVKTWRILCGPHYPPNEDEVRARVLAAADRCYDPAGYLRQVFAINASGDRRDFVRRITAPTLVVHGDADPLVDIAGGRDTAACIEGAEFLLLPGMGHDLAPPLYDTIVEAIARTVARAQTVPA